jgi:hypothetical protein
MVRIAADVDGVAGRATPGEPSKLAALEQIGPTPGLATQHVRLSFARQKHAVGQVPTAAFHRGAQHPQLVLLELLQQHHHIAIAAPLLLARLQQPFSQIGPSAPEHEHVTTFGGHW